MKAFIWIQVWLMSSLHLHRFVVSIFKKRMFILDSISKPFSNCKGQFYITKYCEIIIKSHISCILSTHLKEMVKCDSLVKFIRFLDVEKTSHKHLSNKHRITLDIMLTLCIVSIVPCDPLKYWPPPAWLHQRCFWPFPFLEPHCETTAPPPPKETEINRTADGEMKAVNNLTQIFGLERRVKLKWLLPSLINS